MNTIDKLHEKRQIELAKNILESHGYVIKEKDTIKKVNRKITESKLREAGDATFELVNADESKIRELENGSAFTWEGMTTDKGNLEAIVEFFKENTPGIRLPIIFYTWKGKEFNNMYGLTGDNAYPDDLSFLSIALDNWDNMGSLPMIKFQVGARWLDDIVDNNARREGRDDESDKPIKEASEGDRIKVILNNSSKVPESTEFNEIIDSLDQYDLYPLNDETPCPWDADISFEGNNVVLSGGIAPGGSGGTCTVKVPIDKFSQYFYLEFQLAEDIDVEDFFDKYNWDYTIL